MCYNDPIKVYSLKEQRFVVLRPYMRYINDIDTRGVSDEQWEDALRHSVSDKEWDTILQGRQRNTK